MAEDLQERSLKDRLENWVQRPPKNPSVRSRLHPSSSLFLFIYPSSFSVERQEINRSVRVRRKKRQTQIKHINRVWRKVWAGKEEEKGKRGTGCCYCRQTGCRRRPRRLAGTLPPRCIPLSLLSAPFLPCFGISSRLRPIFPSSVSISSLFRAVGVRCCILPSSQPSSSCAISLSLPLLPPPVPVGPPIPPVSPAFLHCRHLQPPPPLLRVTSSPLEVLKHSRSSLVWLQWTRVLAAVVDSSGYRAKGRCQGPRRSRKNVPPTFAPAYHSF